MPEVLLKYRDKNLRIERDREGTPHIWADSKVHAYWGLGYCHARDRSLQFLMMRILGQGRASEILDSSKETLEVDLFFRRMNWSSHTKEEVAKLSGETKELCQAYCQGINDYLAKKVPWELRLLGYRRPRPWTIEDMILLSRIVGYISLSESHADIERTMVEVLQSNIEKEKVEELFPGIFEEANLELLKKVKIARPYIPKEADWLRSTPPMISSNNWVISGDKTTSGAPFLANDPHLEINRLPNIWYEVALHVGDRYQIGASMPGLPAVVLGRNNEVAWGATYTFMDTVDFWVEKCKGGQYFKEGQWRDFQIRKEVIDRKGKEPYETVFYHNDHGILEGDPHQEGYYLSCRWTGSKSGGTSLEVMTEMFEVNSVEKGMEFLGQMETSWNWLLADREGNIGYQMSGLMPLRPRGKSGRFPLPGWKGENDWQGFVKYTDLPRVYNPEKGYFITANQDLNLWGNQNPINTCQGPYRADRLEELISEKETLGPEDMERMQMDVYSLQAERFMEILSPLLPSSPEGEILKNWDCKYDVESKGAYLFERLYRKILLEVFGLGGLGMEVMEFLLDETPIINDFFCNFDRILLASESKWFGEESREEIFRRAIAKTFPCKPRRWGEENQVNLNHLLLGGKLPSWLGFDRGPMALAGGRATPHQGQIYRTGGRLTSFAPSFRFYTDLSQSKLYTSLAGGPSDRRFSRWYVSDLENWQEGKYKVLEGKKKPL